MKTLLFYAGKNCFALDCLRVEKVVPFLELEPIVTNSSCVVGLLQIEKSVIAVVDFCLLLEKRSTDFLLSSRIIIVQDPRLKTPGERTLFLGILAEKVFELTEIDAKAFVPVDFHPHLYPFLSKVVVKNEKMIQYLDLGLFFSFVSQEFIS